MCIRDRVYDGLHGSHQRILALLHGIDETLRQQLGEQDLTPHQRELAEYLIGSLDDDGLLRLSLIHI